MGNVYAHSLAAEKLSRSQHPAIACLDIDSTLTGNHALADEVRATLQAAGYVITFITSRTEEMIMTSASYDRSVREGALSRPAPHLGHADGRWVYVPPERITPAGVLDGDVIAGSTGTRILGRQDDGGYLEDTRYQERFGESSATWRDHTLAFVGLTIERTGVCARLASIEHPESYEGGVVDIYPPDYRVQVDFDSPLDKVQFVRGARALRIQTGTLNLRMTDDSAPDHGGYKLFLTPRMASKAHAAERIVECLSTTSGVDRRQLTVLFAGDSFPDLKMGLFGGLGTDATLLLVGGSRLATVLADPNIMDFVGEPLSAYRRRLAPDDSPGTFVFRLPLPRHGRRQLVIGDIAFPGTAAVETVQRYVTQRILTSLPVPQP